MEKVESQSQSAVRMRRLREEYREQGVPEVGGMDHACAVVLSIYIAKSAQLGEAGEKLADGLKDMVTQALVNAGYCRHESRRRVSNRLYYLDMCARYPKASAREKRFWELGPPPPELEWERDITVEPEDDDVFGRYIAHPDEGGFDGD